MFSEPELQVLGRFSHATHVFHSVAYMNQPPCLVTRTDAQYIPKRGETERGGCLVGDFREKGNFVLCYNGTDIQCSSMTRVPLRFCAVNMEKIQNTCIALVTL